MGDHRVSLKITIEMHDKKEKMDAWINWSENIGEEYGQWIQDKIDRIKLENWQKQMDD